MAAVGDGKGKEVGKELPVFLTKCMSPTPSPPTTGWRDRVVERSERLRTETAAKIEGENDAVRGYDDLIIEAASHAHTAMYDETAMPVQCMQYRHRAHAHGAAEVCLYRLASQVRRHNVVLPTDIYWYMVLLNVL